MVQVTNLPASRKASFLKRIDPKATRRVLLRVVPGLVFFVFLLFPSCFRYQGVRANLVDTEAQLSAARSTIAQAGRLQGNRGVYLDTIRTMESRFFNEDDIPQFLPVFSELARQQNLRTVSSKPKEKDPNEMLTLGQMPGQTPAGFPQVPGAPGMPTVPGQLPLMLKPGFYREHVYEIGLQGRYHDLGIFLSELRRHRKFMYSNKLTIESNQDYPQEHQIKMDVMIYTKLPIKGK